MLVLMMMMPFNCSYRNRKEPSAIYPSFGYSRRMLVLKTRLESRAFVSK
jgi:hypothetical protein